MSWRETYCAGRRYVDVSITAAAAPQTLLTRSSDILGDAAGLGVEHFNGTRRHAACRFLNMRCGKQLDKKAARSFWNEFGMVVEPVSPKMYSLFPL